MKFLCDQMFGTLAKWLRLCGFDTWYEKEKINDNELLEIASRDNRTILSRDRELIQRARKRQIPGYYIKSRDIYSQLQEVLSKTHQKISTDQMLSRCSVCNYPIARIEKNAIIDSIPPKVAETKELYWRCPNCQRIYWQGTHYEKILQTLQKIKNNPKNHS